MYQRTKASVIILGVVFTLLGLLMFIFPYRTEYFLILCVAWMLIFGGVATVINHFRTEKDARSGSDLVFGIVEFILGILILLWPGITMFELGLFIGAAIMVNGVMDCIEAFSMRGVDGSRWGLWLALGIITVIFGCIAFLSPFVLNGAIMLVLGISLVFDGITEIVYGIRM